MLLYIHIIIKFKGSESMVDIPLVNPQGQIIGKSEKIEAHKTGQLHLAFSILIMNDQQQMLIHQRADDKYHSGGLWTNACCSHPQVDEPIEKAIHRRLIEEMGFDTDLKFLFKFQYKKSFDNNLIEHELDHVYIGYYTGKVNPDANEVKAFQWIDLDKLLKDYKERPNQYTYWFKIILEKLEMDYKGEL
jgi:isopentenyl-diphosphate delta-isomerase